MAKTLKVGQADLFRPWTSGRTLPRLEGVHYPVAPLPFTHEVRPSIRRRLPLSGAHLPDVAHEDDRIVLQGMDELGHVPHALRHEHRLMAYARAVRAAQDDGVVWSPLFDRLSASGEWPIGEGVLDTVVRPLAVFPASAANWIARLKPWISSQSSPSGLYPLLSFRSPVIHRALIAYARCLDPRIVDALHPDALDSLAESPLLDEDLALRLQQRLIGYMARGGKAVGASIATLDLLARRGWGLSPAAMEVIVTSLTDGVRSVYGEQLRRLSQYEFPWKRDVPPVQPAGDRSGAAEARLR